MRRLACVLASCLWCVPALAAPRVLVDHVARTRPGLCDALRIQLGAGAVLCREDGAAQDALDARLAELARAVRAERAELGVFVAAGSEHAVQMIVVGQEDDTAILVFEPRRTGSEHDVDRSLALKVVETLDSVARARVSGPVAVPLALSLAPAAADVPRWSLLVEGLVGLRVEPALRGTLGAASGVRSAGARSALELVLGVEVPTLAHARVPAGTLELRRVEVGLTARALRTFARMELGAGLGLALAELRATGNAARGATGRERMARAELALTALLRVRLFGTAYVALVPRLTVSPVAAEFVIDDVRAARLGQVRFDLPLVLGVHTP